MKRIAGIYRIVHIESGHLYIGRTVNWGRRQPAHVWHLERGKHQNPKLQRAWDKYGPEAFRFEFLEEVPREDLVAREQSYLDELQPFYNVALNAANPVLSPVKTHCPAGHPYEGKNRVVTRDGDIKCRTCNAARTNARWRRLQEEAGREIGVYTRDRTHCPRGHAYAEHGAVRANGWRSCKKCRRDEKKAAYHAKRIAEGHEPPVANKDRTHCQRGHAFTVENTWTDKHGWRRCLACVNLRAEQDRKAQGLPPARAFKDRTHCPQGHAYSTENTTLRANGGRRCRECERQTCARYRARLKAARENPDA